jgi:hypothetical protein
MQDLRGRRVGLIPENLGSVEILIIFFSTFLGATARNASAPAAGHPLWSDNIRESNTTPS